MARNFVIHYPPGASHWRRPNPGQDALTGNGSVAARLVRITAGRLSSGSWSKHLDDATGLDGSTWGIAHWARENVRELFPALVAANPQRAREVWGAEGAARLSDPSWIADNDPPTDDDGLARMAWVVEGFQEIAGEPWAARVQLDLWWAEIVAPAVARWRSVGWTSARGLALCVRARNSSGTWLRRVTEMAGALPESEAVLWGLDWYKSERDDGEFSSRSENIQRLFPDAGERAGAPSVEDLDWRAYSTWYATGKIPPPTRSGTSRGRLLTAAAILGALWWRKRRRAAW